MPPVELPSRHIPREVAVSREETASSCLSLKAEIDQFYFEGEEEAPERLVELSDFEGELDRSSVAHSPRLVIAQVNTSSKEEGEISLNTRKGLRDLMAGRNKGFTSKDIPKSQIPLSLPPPPTIDLGLLPIPNLKKKRKEQELEEGEVVPQKGAKQPKTAKKPKDKRASSMDSREEHNRAKVRIQQCTWSPWLEVDGATIPWNASIKEFQR